MKVMSNELKTEKFIVFTIGDYDLALPIEQVLQVMNCPSMPTEVSKTGLVQVGRRWIRLLNLYERLNLQDWIHAAKPQSFLVITHDFSGEFCAISVLEPPTLIELPTGAMQALPQSNPHHKILEIASHAAVSQDEISATIFLLDLKRTLSAIAPAILPIPEQQSS